jgi:hypothetical protein
MATLVTSYGKNALFTAGWTTAIVRARLYTNLDALVDTQTIAMAYNSSTDTLSPTADIVFAVGAGVNDVAYVEIGFIDGGSLWVGFYSKDLPSLYDFSTAGTLTIDSWAITFGGTSLTVAGKDVLVPSGFTSTVVSAKLYNASDVLLDTQSVTLTSSAGTGIMSPTADIVFNVATGGVAYYITLVTSGAVAVYKRILSTSYTFTTAGTLTVDAWSITI